MDRECIELVGYMKLQSKLNTNLYPNIFFNLINIPVIVFSLNFILVSLKSQKYNLGLVNIISIIFGVSISVPPKEGFKRIIMIHLILLSSIYSSHLISGLFEVLMLKDEIQFNDIQEINQSGFKVITPSVLYHRSLIGDPREIELIKNNMQLVDDVNCDAILKNEKMICVVPEIMLNEVFHPVDMYTREVRRVDASFGCLEVVLPFKNASPFWKKFKRMITLFHEAGLPSRWYNIFLKKELHFEPPMMLTGKSYLLSVVSILTLGYVMSLIAFVVEQLYYKFKNCLP